MKYLSSRRRTYIYQFDQLFKSAINDNIVAIQRTAGGCSCESGKPTRRLTNANKDGNDKGINVKT